MINPLRSEREAFRFLLPRPALVTLARTRWLRHGTRVLRRPIVAVPVYVLVLYGWHFSAKEHRGVEVPGIYWHFVDVMWILVYSTIYVL